MRSIFDGITIFFDVCVDRIDDARWLLRQLNTQGNYNEKKKKNEHQWNGKSSVYFFVLFLFVIPG